MNPHDLARLRLVAELIETRERGDLARLTRQANERRHEIHRLTASLDGMEAALTPGVAEKYRRWCLQRIETETAALAKVEKTVERQSEVLARTSARTKVLERLEMDALQKDKKFRQSRALEFSSHPGGRYRGQGRP